MSAELFPLTEPEWTGRLIDVMVPPQIVSRRGEPEYFSAPATEALALNGSDGNAALEGAGPDTSTRSHTPLALQALPAALVTFHVAEEVVDARSP